MGAGCITVPFNALSPSFYFTVSLAPKLNNLAVVMVAKGIIIVELGAAPFTGIRPGPSAVGLFRIFYFYPAYSWDYLIDSTEIVKGFILCHEQDSPLP